MRLTRTIFLLLLSLVILNACGNEPQHKTFKEKIGECENTIYALDSEISSAHEAYFAAESNAPIHSPKEMASYYASNVIPSIIKAESKSNEAVSKIENLLNNIQNDSTYSDSQKKWFSSFLGQMKKVYSFRAEYYSATLLATKNIGSDIMMVKALLSEAEGKRGASDASRVLAAALLSAVKNPVPAKPDADQK